MTAYPSLNNIAPHVWGPHAWRFLHALALTYPDNPTTEEKTAASQLFSALQYLLPCESCKLNYKNELKMFPLSPALNNKQSLNEWLTKLHNSVNARLKKTVMTPEQVLQYVFEKSQKDLNPQHNDTVSTLAPSTTTSTPHTWGIVATCVAGGLFITVLVLAALYQKQKKVLRK